MVVCHVCKNKLNPENIGMDWWYCEFCEKKFTIKKEKVKLTAKKIYLIKII